MQKLLGQSFGPGKRQFFSIGFVKGMARACACLTLLSLCKEDNLDPVTVVPRLAKTVVDIDVLPLKVAERVQLLMESAKLSNRGSIRRSWNIATWAGALLQLQDAGTRNASTIIKRWELHARVAH